MAFAAKYVRPQWGQRGRVIKLARISFDPTVSNLMCSLWSRSASTVPSPNMSWMTRSPIVNELVVPVARPVAAIDGQWFCLTSRFARWFC